MRRTRETRAAGIALTLLLCGGGAVANEQLEARAERWLPGIAITSAGLFQDRQATASTAERGKFDGASTAALWSMGLQASIATPVLLDVPGRPRLVAQGGFLARFDTEEPLVNEGDPGTPEVPERVGGGGRFAPLASVRGRGTAARVESEPVGWTAGLGVSFETVLLDRVFRVTPSVEYSWQEDTLRGVFGEAEPVGTDPDFCNPACRTVGIDASTTQDFHSLGPGLEIEAEVARFHDFALTLLLSTQVLHVLGDRDMKLSTSAAWMTDGMPAAGRADSTLTTTYERDPWHYRAGLGVRLLWLPEAY